jgi:hypothetical protein
MSEEALDALAGVWIAYLDRIGHTLAIGVESSNRSSAHCNIVDCLRAVELSNESIWIRQQQQQLQRQRMLMLMLLSQLLLPNRTPN